MKKINNHIVVIAGASGGIGSAICEKLESKVKALICLNRKYSGTALSGETIVEYIKADTGNTCEWDRVANMIIDKYKRINVFINCIGTVNTGKLTDQKDDDICKLIETNLLLHVYSIKAILPVMERQGCGHIIEIGSLGGLIPMPFVSTYAASKFALRGLVLSIREEIRNSGVDISLLNPGPVFTNMLEEESKDPDAVISFAEPSLCAEKVALSVLHLMLHPKPEMTIPFSSIFPGKILNQFPDLFHKLYPFIKHRGLKGQRLFKEKFTGGIL
jgi:uncharacterized protein